MTTPIADRYDDEWLNLRPGQRVLDLGCGPATDTLALGRRVGPAGLVSGVDYDLSVVEQARERARAAGLDGWVSHHHANATALPWPDGYFDAARSAGMFQYLIEPELALDEMLRVTRPGGHVLVEDTDWASLSIDSDDTDIERALVGHFATYLRAGAYTARRLPRWFAARGLLAVHVQAQALVMANLAEAQHRLQLDSLEREALAAGVLSPEQARRWQAGLQYGAACGSFFASANVLAVCGCRP